ncbi:hypothetical protein WN943_014286 [Citrus x changshan-huyou]
MDGRYWAHNKPMHASTGKLRRLYRKVNKRLWFGHFSTAATYGGVESLVCLEEITSDCSNLEEIFGKKKGGDGEMEMVAAVEKWPNHNLSMLETCEVKPLHNLHCEKARTTQETESSVLRSASLSCFCSGPVLEELEIDGCPDMKTFGYGDQMTPKLKNVKLQGENRWTGNLDNTVQSFFYKQPIPPLVFVEPRPDLVSNQESPGSS